MIPLSDRIKKNKLAISFMLILLIFISIGIFTIKGLYTLGDLTRRIYEHPLVVSNASLQAALDITKIHRDMKDVVLAIYPDEIKATLKAVSRTEQRVYQHLDRVRDNILGEEGKALEKQARQLFEKWKPTREEVIQLFEAGNKQGAIFITKSKGAEHVAKLEAKMLELTSYAIKKADSFIELAEKEHSKLEMIILVLTLLGILVSIAISFNAINRVLKAENLLRDKNKTLQKALDEIKTLQGILPICSFCKNIRNDQGYYEQIESYIHKHSGVDFSHTICPSCMEKHYPEEYESIMSKKKNHRPLKRGRPVTLLG
jgi:hypothetical protein